MTHQSQPAFSLLSAAIVFGGDVGHAAGELSECWEFGPSGAALVTADGIGIEPTKGFALD
jgi:hypothetical protein